MRYKDVALFILVALVLMACGDRTNGTAEPAARASRPGINLSSPTPEPLALPAAPAVPDPNDDYAGATITFYGDSIGLGPELDRRLAEQFTADTGITVQLLSDQELATITDATSRLATYERIFQARSSRMDVLLLDVIWVGRFAPHLVALDEALGTEVERHNPDIRQNNTVDGTLRAMPWFIDFGVLYYRSDLLQTYGYDRPPQTWTELEEMAQTIQEGERATGNSNFWGFVWQGAAYEGLTCNALEWIASHGGTLVDAEGTITVNTPEAQAALEQARGWIGTISPPEITRYTETETRAVFRNGNAAFMRDWPTAYALLQDPAIAGQFGVAPLPHAPGQQSVGVVGGQQLGVSRYSRNQEAAIEFVRYMTSPEVQTWRAQTGAYIPTIDSTLDDDAVGAALPFLANVPNDDFVFVLRPSHVDGVNYPGISQSFFLGTQQILADQDADIPRIMTRIDDRIHRLMQ